ncbi:MAG: hypothetical protein ACLQPD_22405 [Desulfomonilaceae bacterium]
MVLIAVCWLGMGLLNIAIAYAWAQRPFSVRDCIAFLIGGPVFLGCLCIVFLGGHCLLRGIDTRPETGMVKEGSEAGCPSAVILESQTTSVETSTTRVAA